MPQSPVTTVSTGIPADALTAASARVLCGVALRDILAERIEQVDRHGYDLAHDMMHDPATIAAGAASYLDTAIDALEGRHHPADQPPLTWPWEDQAWKPGEKRAMLVKAAAILWAAIDRLDAAADKGDAA